MTLRSPTAWSDLWRRSIIGSGGTDVSELRRVGRIALDAEFLSTCGGHRPRSPYDARDFRSQQLRPTRARSLRVGALSVHVCPDSAGRCCASPGYLDEAAAIGVGTP